MVYKKNIEENVTHNPSAPLNNYKEAQHHKIALAAYYKAENRGFSPGHELNDWLEAEHDIMGNP